MDERDLTQVWPVTRAWPAPEPGHRDGVAMLYPQESGTLRLGMIASRDGYAAGPDGSSRSLNGPADHRILRALRAQADVVLVGGATVRAERYADIPAPADAAHGPDLAIVTRSGHIPTGLDPARTWVVTTSDSPASAATGMDPDRVIIVGDRVINPTRLTHELAARNLGRILCEGGPTLAGWLLDVDAVDEFCLTHSPLVGGKDQSRIPTIPDTMTLAHRLTGGGFTMERWTRGQQTASRP